MRTKTVSHGREAKSNTTHSRKVCNQPFHKISKHTLSTASALCRATLLNLTSGEQKCSGRASDELRKLFRTPMSWKNTSETLPVILLMLSKKQWSMKQKRTNYCDHQAGQQDCTNLRRTNG
jgi:hypothetical protein